MLTQYVLTVHCSRLNIAIAHVEQLRTSAVAGKFTYPENKVGNERYSASNNPFQVCKTTYSHIQEARSPRKTSPNNWSVQVKHSLTNWTLKLGEGRGCLFVLRLSRQSKKEKSRTKTNLFATNRDGSKRRDGKWRSKVYCSQRAWGKVSNVPTKYIVIVIYRNITHYVLCVTHIIKRDGSPLPRRCQALCICK